MDSPVKQCPRCGTRYDAAATFCQRDGAPLTFVEDAPDPYIGRVLLEQFRIEEAIGQGGMGVVYRARQTTVDRDVAIKILHQDLVQNPDAVRRFHREARVSTAFDHPNLVRVFLFGQFPDKSLYLVMEFLRGRSLVDLLRAEQRLATGRALHITTQICDGVGEAHDHGVVHRDVKPDNVYIVTRGRDPDFVKVLDFGIARFLWGEQTVATQSGLIFGTARYISPEGASGETTDARSDVYSIAVLTYQLLVGRTPFEGSSPVALLMKHIHEPAPDVRTFGQVPGPVGDVIMRALAKNPDARYADAQALGEALRQAATSAGILIAAERTSHSPATPRGPIAPVTPARRPADPAMAGRPSVPTAQLGTAAPEAAVPVPVVASGSLPGAHGPGGTATPTPITAPSPFGGSTAALEVPGLGKRRRGPPGPVTLVLTAFLLGATAVAAGAWVAGIMRGKHSTGDAAALTSRAQQALALGHYDSPPGECVSDLTIRLLALKPRDSTAMALRQRAADKLRLAGDGALAAGRRSQAEDLYKRALALDPELRQADDALDALEREPVRPDPGPPGIRFEPDAPKAGDPAKLLAVLPPAMALSEGEHPHFRVWRGNRLIGDDLSGARGETARTWVTTYTFAHPGRYAVAVDLPGGKDDALRTELTVGHPRRARVGHDEEGPTTTQGGTHQPSDGQGGSTHGGDGIDWGLPPMFSPTAANGHGVQPPAGDGTTPPAGVTPAPPSQAPPPAPPHQAQTQTPPDHTQTQAPPPPWTGSSSGSGSGSGGGSSGWL